MWINHIRHIPHTRNSGVTKHCTSRTSSVPTPNIGISGIKKRSNRRVQSVNACDASTSTDLIWTAFQSRGSPVSPGRFRWCGLRPRLGTLLTVKCAIGRFDSAYSAESTDGTLTKSVTKTILFQYSKYTYYGGRCGASATGAVFRDTSSNSNTYWLDMKRHSSGVESSSSSYSFIRQVHVNSEAYR